MTEQHTTDETSRWTVLQRGTNATDESNPDNLARRRFLVAGAAGMSIALAGCLGDDYEDEYEQALQDLEEKDTQIDNLEQQLQEAQDDLDEKSRNHIIVSNTYLANGQGIDPEFDRFSRSDTLQTVYVQGAPVGFRVGIYEANTGASTPPERVEEATVTIEGLGQELALEWNSQREIWQAVLKETDDLAADVYEYTISVTLDGEVRHLQTHEGTFEIVEYVAQTHAVEYTDPKGTVAGLDERETIDVPETQELLIAGEEEGWNLPYNCRRGVCGRCVAKTDVDVDEHVEMSENEVLEDEHIEEGYFLTCTGQPRDGFSFETDVYDEIRDEL